LPAPVLDHLLILGRPGGFLDPVQMLDKLRRQQAGVRELVHASRYTKLAPSWPR